MRGVKAWRNFPFRMESKNSLTPHYESGAFLDAALRRQEVEHCHEYRMRWIIAKIHATRNVDRFEEVRKRVLLEKRAQ